MPTEYVSYNIYGCTLKDGTVNYDNRTFTPSQRTSQCGGYWISSCVLLPNAFGLNKLDAEPPLKYTLYSDVSKPMGQRILNYTQCETYANTGYVIPLDIENVTDRPFGCSIDSNMDKVYYNDGYDDGNGEMVLSNDCGLITGGGIQWSCVYIQTCNDAGTCQIGDRCTTDMGCLGNSEPEQLCVVDGSVTAERPFFDSCYDGNGSIPPESCSCKEKATLPSCRDINECRNDEECLERDDCGTGLVCYKADEDYFTFKGIISDYLTKCAFNGDYCRCFVSAKGPRGATGPAGPSNGIVGPRGVIGPRGAQGVVGPRGARGPTGPAWGPTGPQGIRGEVGFQGIQGVQGDSGIDSDGGEFKIMIWVGIGLGSVSFVIGIVILILILRPKSGYLRLGRTERTD